MQEYYVLLGYRSETLNWLISCSSYFVHFLRLLNRGRSNKHNKRIYTSFIRYIHVTYQIIVAPTVFIHFDDYNKEGGGGHAMSMFLSLI